jgi:hypothetical protein
MHAVAPYLVQVKDENHDAQDLTKFFRTESLRGVLIDYYKANLRNYQRSPSQANRMFMVSRLCTGSADSVCGSYQTGQHGFESDIYSTTQKKVTHRRQVDEADMMPFNFAFYLPEAAPRAQRSRGLLLLGRFNTLGVRHITIPHLQTYFKNRFPGFSIEINRVVPKVVLETMLKVGTLKTIRLIRKTLPPDVADALSPEDGDRVQDVELVIHSKKRSYFKDVDWLLRTIDGRSSPSDVVTVQSFPHDSIKLEIRVDGNTRTVDLGNTGRLSSNIELPGLKLGANGHPTLQSWLAEADTLASEVVESWGAGKHLFVSAP